MANAILAAILSFFFPGIGQIYAGETKKGVIFLVIWILLFVLGPFTASLSWIVQFFFSIYAAYDAYKLAQ